MAQLIGQETEEDKKKKEEASGPITGPSPITQPQTGSGAPSASTAQQGPAPKGTGFTNIAKVKQANIGGEQKLAGAVTQDVTQAAKTGMSQLSQMYQNYSQQIQSQKLGADTSGVKSLIEKQAGGGQLSDAEKAQVAKYAQYSYAGPQTLSTQDQAALTAQQNAAKAARDKALTSLSATGRTSILGKMGLGQQGLYTPGAGRLDEMFLGGKAARGVLSQAGSEAERLASEASGLSGKVQQDIQQAKSESEAAKSGVLGLIGEKEAAIKEAAKARMGQASTEEATRADKAADFSSALQKMSTTGEGLTEGKIQGALESGLISAEDAGVLKDISSDPELARVAGNRLSKALSGSYQGAALGKSPEDYYTQEDVSKLTGLAGFLGKDTSGIRAGSGPQKGQFSLDKAALRQALESSLGEFAQGEVGAEQQAAELGKQAQEAKNRWTQSVMATGAPSSSDQAKGLNTGLSGMGQGDEGLKKEYERYAGAAAEKRAASESARARKLALSKYKSKWGF